MTVFVNLKDLMTFFLSLSYARIVTFSPILSHTHPGYIETHNIASCPNIILIARVTFTSAFTYAMAHQIGDSQSRLQLTHCTYTDARYNN